MKKEKTGKFKWVLAGILALIVGGEIAARHFVGLGNPPISIEDPEIEYLFRPNQEGNRFGNHFFFNQYGMRSDNFPAKRKGNEIRIMVFGDSVLNGGNLTDQSALATSLIKKRLVQLTNKEVVVGNIAAGSWGPGNWLAYARKFGFFDADVVVLVVSSHDYADNPTFGPLNPDTHPTERPVSALIEGAMRYLPRLGSYESGQKSKPRNQPTPDEVAKGLGDLRIFLGSAKDATGSVLVFQHWEKSEVGKNKANPGNEEIGTLCEAMGIYHEQLGPHFKRAADRGSEPYRDNIHPNQIGQQLIADAIMEKLLKSPM